MKEIWKPLENYEGLYEVSNYGIVKSLNYRKTGKERILKGNANGDGYLRVTLTKNGKKKTCRINRLVAQAFIPNPDNLPEVNHKDEDKTNNKVENLEWCTRAYNCNYGTRSKKVAEKLSKPIYSIDKESGLVTYWESATVAERQTGISNKHINDCLKGRRKSAGGYYWFYASDSEEVANGK